MSVLEKKSSKQQDFLPLQWYEVNRTFIKRTTEQGLNIQIERPPLHPIEEGEILFENLEVQVRAKILSCECIVLTTNDLYQIGSFCFDVGNQHLPIFMIDNKVIVAYDGRLYQTLIGKYKNNITLESKVLKPTYAIRAFGNIL